MIMLNFIELRVFYEYSYDTDKNTFTVIPDYYALFAAS